MKYNRTATAVIISLVFLLFLGVFSFQAELISIFIIFFFVFALPAVFIFNEYTDVLFVTAISAFPFLLWFQTANPYLIKTPVLYIFLTLTLFFLYMKKKKIVLDINDIIMFSYIMLYLLFSVRRQFVNNIIEFSVQLNSLFFVYLIARSSEQKNRIVNFLIYISVIISLYGIFQWLGLDPYFKGEIFDIPFRGRIIGTLGNSNFFAGYLLGISAMTYYIAIHKPGPYIITALILQFIAMAGSQTRGVLLAVLIGIITLILLKIKTKTNVLILLFFILLILMIPGTRRRFTNIPKEVFKRHASPGQRQLMWSCALEIIRKRPLGSGPAAYRLNYPDIQKDFLRELQFLNLSTHARHPHNHFLSTGVISPMLLFLFILIIALTVRGFFTQKSTIKKAMLFGLILVFIDSNWSVVLNYESAAIFFGLAFSFMPVSKRSFSIHRSFILPFIVINLIFSYLYIDRTKASHYFFKANGYQNHYLLKKDEMLLDRAEQLYIKALQHDKYDVNIPYKTANNFIMRSLVSSQKTDLYEKALKYFKIADDLKPSYWEIRYNMALVYQNLKEYEKARGYFLRSLDLEPANLKVLRSLCEMMMQLEEKTGFERSSEYLKMLEDAIDLNLESIAYISQAKASIVKKKAMEAKLFHHKNMGYINFRSEKITDSISYFEKATEIAEIIDDEAEYKMIMNNLVAISKKYDTELLKKYLNDLVQRYPGSLEVNTEMIMYEIKYADKEKGTGKLRELLRQLDEKGKDRVRSMMRTNSLEHIYIDDTK